MNISFTKMHGLGNDFIDTSYTSVQYSSFDRAVMIKKLGFKAQC
jgi:diaminopimelate epimerase